MTGASSATFTDDVQEVFLQAVSIVLSVDREQVYITGYTDQPIVVKRLIRLLATSLVVEYAVRYTVTERNIASVPSIETVSESIAGNSTEGGGILDTMIALAQGGNATSLSTILGLTISPATIVKETRYITVAPSQGIIYL